MTTKTRLPSPPAEQRLANSYDGPNQVGRPPTPPPDEPSPEARMAAGYRHAATPGKPAAPQRPPMTPDERLAATYEANPPGDGGEDREPDARQTAESDADKAQLRAPEGYELDDETASGLASIATELKLPAGAMQQLVDKASPLLNARTARHLQLTMDKWIEETTNDPVIGGEKLDGSVQLARTALDRFGSPELRKLIGPLSKGGTGLGNNKALLHFLVRVGRELA